MKTPKFLPLLILLFATPSAWAYEPGDEVVIVDEECEIVLDQETAIAGPLGEVLVVAQELEDGEFLRIDAGVPAFTLASNVVPLAEAVDHFTARIEDEGPQVSTLVARAHVQEFLGQFDAAIEDLTAVIELEPEGAEWYTARGNMYTSAAQYPQAIEDFDAALAITGGDSTNYYNLGNCYSHQGEYQQALESFDAAIALDDTHPEYFHNRALTHRLLGDLRSTRDDYRRALAVDPQFARSMNNLAWLLATCPDDELRDGDEALELAQQACELTGWQIPVCLDTLAGAYAETGDYDSAIRAIEAAIEMDNGGPNTALFQEHLEAYRQEQPYRDAGPQGE